MQLMMMMNGQLIVLVMLSTLFAAATLLILPAAVFFNCVGVEAAKSPNPQITVMGMVYCDICYNNSFSTHSYFLPGVEVQIDCKFKANSPRTTEEITFSVNRSTNRYGIYKLEIASVDGIQCARDKAIGNSCRATLLSSSSPACNVPASNTTSDQIAIKSTQSNTCFYSLNALNYRPPTRNPTLCDNID